MVKFKFSKVLVCLTLASGAKMATAGDQPTVAELKKKFEVLEQQAKIAPTLRPKGNIKGNVKADIKPQEPETAQKIQEGSIKTGQDVASPVEDKPAIEVPAVSKEPLSTEKQPSGAQPATAQKMPPLKEIVDLTKPWGLDLEKVEARGFLYRKTEDKNDKRPPEVAIEIHNLQSTKDLLKVVPKAAKLLKEKLEKDRLTLTTQIKEKIEQANTKANEKNSKKIGKGKDTKELSALINKLKDIQNEIAQQPLSFKNPWYLEAEIKRKEDYIVGVLKEFGITHEHIKKLPPLPAMGSKG